MPNWCYNQLEITGSNEEMARFYEAFKGHHPYYPTHKSEFSPDNKRLDPKPLPTETCAEYNKRAKAEHFAAPKTRCFNALYPVPDEVLTWGYDGHDLPGYVYPDLFVLLEDTKSKGQTMDGYHWCVAHWGAKWDISDNEMDIFESDERAQYGFDTAWSPPTKWIMHVSTLFPDLLINLNYTEEGNQCIGVARFQNGSMSELTPDEDTNYWAIYTYIMELRGDSDANSLINSFSWRAPDDLNGIKDSVNEALCDIGSYQDNDFLNRIQYETYLKTVLECIDEAMPEAVMNYAGANAEGDAGGAPSTDESVDIALIKSREENADVF